MSRIGNIELSSIGDIELSKLHGGRGNALGTRKSLVRQLALEPSDCLSLARRSVVLDKIGYKYVG